jgi:hypothetical protein
MSYPDLSILMDLDPAQRCGSGLVFFFVSTMLADMSGRFNPNFTLGAILLQAQNEQSVRDKAGFDPVFSSSLYILYTMLRNRKYFYGSGSEYFKIPLK